MSQPHRRLTGRPGQERQIEFLCRVKYGNNLPDVPFDGKYLACPFVALDRFVDYKPSLLEKEHKSEVLCEADLGVNIDLIDPSTYALTRGMMVENPKDQELLAEETNSQQNSRRSAQHSKIVPWMRKTEYISSEFNRFGVAADRQEIKVGFNIKKNLKEGEEVLYRNKDSQIDAITRTFLDAKKKVKKHYSKPGVYAVEEMPLLPDFDMWKFSFAQVTFDADPSVMGAPESLKTTMMEMGQIRGMQDDSGAQFVTYFCPNAGTIQKRMEDKELGIVFDEDHIYEYPQNREYTWVVRNKLTKGYVQDTFFFAFRDGNVYYNELETRVKLTRRRKMFNKRAILNIQHIEPTPEEVTQMEQRVAALHRPFKLKDDAEEEDSGEESAGEGERKNGSDSDGSRDESPKRAAQNDSDDSDNDNSDKSDKSSEDSDSD